MASLADFVGRTHQKIEYARLILNEHLGSPSQHTGDAFERSHLEAFFFHFGGGVDSFLQELNAHYELGLNDPAVSRRTVREKIIKLGIRVPPFVALETLDGKPDSFMALATSMRNFVAHRGGLPMAHYFNGPTNLVHPVTRQEFPMDSNHLLRGWLAELEAFFMTFRTW